MFGFMSFWHRGEVRTTRRKVLPWHVFLGLYTYGLAVVTAETGLLEKLTFLQTNGNVLKRCPESAIVNGLGLGLALLSSVVISAAAAATPTPTPNQQTSKSSYWNSVVYTVHIVMWMIFKSIQALFSIAKFSCITYSSCITPHGFVEL